MPEPSTAYCSVDDLLAGDIPLPGYLSPQKYVDDAGDEIDSHIGRRYKTPVILDAKKDGATEPFEEDDFVVSRPVRLLLKRINAHLATGRLIMAVAAPQEDANLHAYGWSLVKGSLDALKEIVDGNLALDGVEQVAGTAPVATAPLHFNQDAESHVEAFYDRVVNPDYVYPGQVTHRIYRG